MTGLTRARQAINLVLHKGLGRLEPTKMVSSMRDSLAANLKRIRKSKGRNQAKRYLLKTGAYHNRLLKNTVKNFPGKVGDTRYAPTKTD